MAVHDRGGVVYLRLPDGTWERSPSWEGEDSNPPEVAEIARLRAALKAVRASLVEGEWIECQHAEEREIIDRALRGDA